MKTVKKSLPKESKMESVIMPLSIPISTHSLIQDDVTFYEGLRMSSQVASRARIFPSQTLLAEMEQRALKAKEVDYGNSSQQSFCVLDQNSSLWKIPQSCL